MALSSDTAALTSVRFDPRGYFVITASADGTARVWQAEDGALLTELRGHPGAVRFAGFGLGRTTGGGTMVVTAGDHGFIRLWDFHREERDREAIGDLISTAFPERPKGR